MSSIIYVTALCLFLLSNGLALRGKSASTRVTSRFRVRERLATSRGKAVPVGPLYALTKPEGDNVERGVSSWSPDDLEVLVSEDESVSPRSKADVNAKFIRVAAAVSASIGLTIVLTSILGINSGGVSFAIDNPDMSALFDPKQFNPVCPNSDGVYSLLKGSANFVVGPENVVEYGPLIASVLLRIRLELCVLESFLYEAIIPFVQQKGLSWVLPLHETVETFVAGTIFAAASNFILLGSTKILTVLFVYFDALTGFPARTLGKLLGKAAPKNSASKNVGTGLTAIGEIIGFVRKFLEAADTFVGRYLVIATTAYIAFKFAHFKLFNDII
jgi:hypothetical protein